jgi:hypothetical protein
MNKKLKAEKGKNGIKTAKRGVKNEKIWELHL